MESKEPVVTVLLPTYNCETYVQESLQSILTQTFTDFELIVIDDASTDRTVEVIGAFGDERIRLIRKPQNSGYTDSLNYGIGIARGRYIARMDADDISLPGRFQKQVQFLETHPDVAVCGTWYKEIPSGDVAELPVEHEAIVLNMLSVNAICHPSVMLRKDFFTEHQLAYNRDFESAEDYELWTRVVGLGRVHNLPEVLLHYRVHAQQVTTQRNAFLLQRAALCRKHLLQALLRDFSKKDEDLLETVLTIGTRLRSGQEIVRAVAILNRLQQRNAASGLYRQDAFSAMIEREKMTVVRNGFILNNRFDFGLLRCFFQLKAEKRYLTPNEQLRLLIKCLLFKTY